MSNKEIIGAIYPIPKEVLNRAKGKSEIIFVKNVVHDTIPKKLGPKKKILFYVGRPLKKIFAEAKIKEILFVNYNELKNKFNQEIVQKRDELKNYCGLEYIKGESKKVSFLLEDFEYFEEGLDPISPITMTGKYLSKKEETEIKRKNK